MIHQKSPHDENISQEEVIALTKAEDGGTELDEMNIDLDEGETVEMTSLDKGLQDTETKTSPAIGVALEMDSELKSLMEECEDAEQPKCKACTILPVGSSGSKLEVSGSFCGCGCYKIGSCTVLFPQLYKKTSMGLIGPHFLGVLFTVCLLSSLSFLYITQAMAIGPITTTIACAFTTSCFYNLFLVTTTDPGFIHAKGSRTECRKYLSLSTASEGHDSEEGGTPTFRFCGLCNVYQPSNARHCQDCGMCVVGFDHHCPWMGICIGRFNMKPFIRFNFSWLLWLLYAVGWITVGSTFVKHK